MIEVLLYNSHDVIVVVLHEPVAVVILVLGSEPHVPKLVHNIHSEFIASL